MTRQGIQMTAADVQAHQRRHGFSASENPVIETKSKVPTPVKTSVPEREYSLILAAMKRDGKIVDYRFQGLSLAWGADPRTGRLMRYKCDFVVFPDFGKPIKIIEVKGSKITQEGMARFKGCRAEWEMFQFEMHQRDKDGRWDRVQ